MDNEEQMGQVAQDLAGEDAFAAGMEDKPSVELNEGEGPAADQSGKEALAAQDAARDPGAGEPVAQTPLPDPARAADTPVERLQRFQGVEEFARTFPEAYRRARQDPDSIPDSVWVAVGQGMPLAAAYARHAVDQAEQMDQSARRNRENARRSTGSMRSAGSDVNARDAFLAGFDM